mgnify:CR=1 FL=1
MKTRNHTGHPCGAGHHRAKLTSAQVAEMRAVYAGWKHEGDRRGYGALAKLYGCGLSTARDVITLRTRWAS